MSSPEPEEALEPGAREPSQLPAVVHVAAIVFAVLAFMSVWHSRAMDEGANNSRVFEGMLVSLGAILVLFVPIHQGTPWPRPDRTFTVVMGLFCAWAGLTAAWAPSGSLALGKAGELALLVLVTAFIAEWGAARPASSRSLPTLVAIALLISVSMLVAYNGMTITRGGYHFEHRFFLAYSHPLTTADLLALSIVTLIVSRLGWGLKVPAILVMTFLFSMTNPRSAAGGFVAALGAMGFVRLERRSTQMLIATVGTILTLIAILAFGSEVPRLMDEYLPPDTTTLNGRTELWEFVLTLIPENWFSGFGYYSSRYLLLDRFHWAGHAHNAYLEIALGTGVPGLLLCLVLVLQVLRVALRARDTWLAGIAGYVFSVSMLDPLAMTPGVPMLILLMAAYYAKAKERRGREAADGAAGPGQEGVAEGAFPPRRVEGPQGERERAVRDAGKRGD